jgi:hypothetical protein
VDLSRRVLVFDDDLVRTTFEQWFEEDLQERRRRQGSAALRRLEVDGQVCRTLAELRDALEEADEAGALPDLVLIDDRLQREPRREIVRAALSAVRLVQSMFGNDRPKCVLHSSDLKLNEIRAFCELGGHNAIDKHRRLERTEILWETLDGRRWSPPPLRTDVSVSDANGRLLPYMELPQWKLNARRDLPGLKDDAANRAKSRLVSAFDLVAGAEPGEIVEAANDHGLTWVPLASRHLLPEGHPEHRETAFRHRSQVSET